MRLTDYKSKLSVNLLAKWQEANPACEFLAPGLMTLRAAEILTLCLNYRNRRQPSTHGRADVRASVAHHARAQSRRTAQRTNLMRLPIHDMASKKENCYDSGTENCTAPEVFSPSRAQRMQTLATQTSVCLGACLPWSKQPGSKKTTPSRASGSLCGQVWPLARHVGDKLLPLRLAALGEKPSAVSTTLTGRTIGLLSLLTNG